VDALDVLCRKNITSESRSLVQGREVVSAIIHIVVGRSAKLLTSSPLPGSHLTQSLPESSKYQTFFLGTGKAVAMHQLNCLTVILFCSSLVNRSMRAVNQTTRVHLSQWQGSEQYWCVGYLCTTDYTPGVFSKP
jgi:hypothetical protein